MLHHFEHLMDDFDDVGDVDLDVWEKLNENVMENV
jgi:hypothetical protein